MTARPEVYRIEGRGGGGAEPRADGVRVPGATFRHTSAHSWFDLICRHFYDARFTLNAPAFMDPARIMCAAIVVTLSATSCIDWQNADRHPHPKAAPEPPSVGSSAPGDSIAERVPGEANGQSAPVALPREPPRDETPADRHLRSPHGPGEDHDTWDHIRHLMTVVPVQPHISSLREFRRKLRRYHGNQRFFDSIGSNASPWLYHVAQRLASRGLPGELALLPAVESSYNARAVSPRSAAGLWQILPGTARDLKLSQSWWYDARHDTPAATEAALDYLAFLHDKFNGDWILAVAAYNCGPGNVRRAIRRAGLQIETAHYAAIERHLPKETRGHTVRWLVLSEIVAMPRLHNVRMKTIPWRPYFTEVTAPSQVNLATAARRAGLPPAELTLLNLGFRRGMTAPNGPHRVLVRAEHADRLGRELSQVRPVRVAEGWRYRIREGDTLGAIALAHGTTVKTLMAANRLDSHLIRVGRDLLIPGSGRASSEPEAAAEERGVHVVSAGDSLWRIARLYRTTVNSLRDWNRLAPGSNLLHPGQQLRVRGEG